MFAFVMGLALAVSAGDDSARAQFSACLKTAVDKATAAKVAPDAFADFATLPVETKRESGTAVDISRIKSAREPAKADAKQEQAKTNIKAKPKPPAEPARFWVQVGTGRDVKALGFTWRKVQKQNAALLAKHDAYSARWGATRRLLTGPYKSED